MKNIVGVAIAAALLAAAPATAAFATEGAEPTVCYEDGTSTELTYALQRSDWVAGTPEVVAVPESWTPAGYYGDTRATGHFQAESGRLHIWTEGATSTDKVAGYVSTSIPLAAVAESGAVLNYEAVSGMVPGAQLIVDINGDGAGDGILVGEPSFYGANWWLNNAASAEFKALDPSGANDGGNGSAYFGTLAEWSTAAPTATVVAVGFSLGSGAQGEGYVDGFVTAGTTYSFTTYNAGTPGQPAVPDSYTDWYEVATGQGAALPDGHADGEQFQTDALYRYVVTGQVEVPTQVEVECPVVEPEPTTTPEPSVTPTATPTVTAQPAAAEGDLAETGGSDGALPLLVGGALLVAGIGLTVVLDLRRRRAHQR
jgi:hypothetical protein